MAEYWKSTPKYWCKHCSTHVKDTPLERRQHEATGRHQGNLKRFLRDIQNSHERDEREKQKAKAEVDRLNQQFGGSRSTAQPPTALSSTSSSSQTPQASVADRQRQMAQLAEMGIKLPEDQRKDLGLAGGWHVVSERVVEEPLPEEHLSIGIRKRKHEGQADEADGDETAIRRGWGSTTKRYPGETSEDLDDLLANHKIEKVEGSSMKQENASAAKTEDTEDATDTASPRSPASVTKKEEPSEPPLTDIPPAVAVPVFKKRKPKAGPAK